MFLDSILKKEPLRAVGLSSGTSMDGMDAAAVEIRGSGPETSVDLLAFETLPYPAELRARLLEAARLGGGSTEELCRLNVEVAGVAVAAARRVAEKAGGSIGGVDLIGSHGQTVCHLPDGDHGSTLQIGEGAVIAEETGVTVVSNFRARDLAAGGQGAPLVPYVDWLLFRSGEENRVMLNLGGIANVTLLPGGLGIGAVLGFDTGPGNMVIDGVAALLSGGEVACDRDGAGAARGTVTADLLSRLLRHSYFAKAAPKSAGRESFGDHFVQEVVAAGRELGASDEDLLATVTELTAGSVVMAIALCVTDMGDLGRMIVSGGGVHNRTLMDRLAVLMNPVPVVRLEELGLPSDAKEAVAFAVLANETIHGIPSNVPAVTGARRSVVLGDIAPG